MRITALRRKPWGSHARHAEQQGGGQAPCWPGHQHDWELEAAAEAALADRGCWGQDSARLAAEADIIAGARREGTPGPAAAQCAKPGVSKDHRYNCGPAAPAGLLPNAAVHHDLGGSLVHHLLDCRHCVHSVSCSRAAMAG